MVYRPAEYYRQNVMIYAAKAHPELTGADVVKRLPDGCIKRRQGKLFANGEFHGAYRHGPGTPCSPDS